MKRKKKGKGNTKGGERREKGKRKGNEKERETKEKNEKKSILISPKFKSWQSFCITSSLHTVCCIITSRRHGIF